jgi:hypothetical protein
MGFEVSDFRLTRSAPEINGMAYKGGSEEEVPVSEASTRRLGEGTRRRTPAAQERRTRLNYPRPGRNGNPLIKARATNSHERTR